MIFTKPILMRTGIAAGIGASLGVAYTFLPRCSSMICKSDAWAIGPIAGGAVIFGLVALFSKDS